MPGRDEAKTKAVNKSKALLADISDIKEDADYMCSLGAIVYDENGGEHIVEHAGVAKHPNDEVMQYMAEKVMEKLR